MADPHHAIATRNRLLAADMLAALTPEQWATPSLCEGWTVREIAGHLIAPLESDFTWRSVLGIIVRYRGDLGRYVDEQTRERSARPTDQLVARLRDLADTELTVPFTGSGGPMADSAIHLRDAARPLGIDVSPDLDAWRATLDFLTSKPAMRGFVTKDRLRGLRLVATDQDWAWGEGDEVRGASEAVAMAVAGRAHALADLDGPGVAVLRDRIPGDP
ncbi:uncharacterized protein (TIGR03083 family) [Knoellia remsis]|uniref:Uncharacterized protein (TIGR03083 family) n=1 Tax=Knoellia remsis TaxID=407159 RepID=A0A2T0U802_9MICO|nr:maleylpyruvate isomerase family mycothiol-dependent enzyme [Knoellia remsis]PRY54002.1 uncharacterized protein (TIGR03083 family) [Knoellia remsis]